MYPASSFCLWISTFPNIVSWKDCPSPLPHLGTCVEDHVTIDCVLSHFSRARLFETLRTVACQAPLSMGFSKQEYWSGLPCPPPRDLPEPGMEPTSLKPSALAGGFFTTSASWDHRQGGFIAGLSVLTHWAACYWERQSCPCSLLTLTQLYKNEPRAWNTALPKR